MKIKLKSIPYKKKRKYLELIMRTFLMLFCTTVFSFSSTNILSQSTKIIIKKDAIVSVEEVFELIRNQTDHSFIYKDEFFVDAPKIELKKGVIKANKLLEKALSFGSFKFKLSKKGSIILERSPVKASKKQKISGTVTDNKGVPLSGVTVISYTLDNQQFKGAYTDLDGKYEIIAEIGGNVLFSFIGYANKGLVVKKGKNVYDVVLQEDTNELEEVVITGYQKINKERATGAFSKVNSNKLEQRPVTNIIDRLEGTVAGLNVVKDSNGKQAFQIRGLSTLHAGSEALIVVDGFPIEGDLSTINPQDIASVTVLKDAPAASIWGVRASNGVVVITTKKGKKNQKLAITASTYISITDKVDYSKQNYMSTSDQIDMSLEYYRKLGMGPEAFVNFGLPISLLDEALLYANGSSPDGDIWSQEQYTKYVNKLRTQSSERQWEKYLLRTPIRNTYNLSIYGGSEKNTFYGSIVYNDESLASIGNSSDEFILNLQDSYTFNDKLNFNFGVTTLLNKTNANGVAPSAITQTNAFDNLVDEKGHLVQYYTVRDPWTSRNREAIDGVSSYTFNQLEEQRNSDNTNERFSVRAQLGIDYNILKNLKFSSTFQYEKGSFNTNTYNTMNLPSHRVKVNEFFVNGENRIPLGTEYRFTRQDFYAWNFRNTLTWDKRWKENKLDVFVGTETRKSVTANISDKKYGYDRQADTSIPVDIPTFISGNVFNWSGQRDRSLSQGFFETSHTDDREFSAFANAAYKYLNKYSINGSFRIDQKNLFGSDSDFRYKPLWSTGIGWDIHKENFLSNNNLINQLKLRATYGVVGNASNLFSPFAQAVNKVSLVSGVSFNYLDLTKAANEKLKWEETKVFNAGLDFSLLDSKLNGSIEYYIRDSQDLLGSIEFDPTVGFSSAIVNYASMTNKGVELELNATIIDAKNFKWNSNFNFSYNKNEVTQIENDQTTGQILFGGRIAVGDAANTLYATNYAGLDANGDVLVQNSDGTVSNWKDLNFFDYPKEELIKMGNSVAPYYGGFSNTFNYKGLDLTVNMTYKFGHKFRRDPGISSDGFNSVGKTLNLWSNRWQKPGDELTTRVPGISYNGLNPETGQIEDFGDGNLRDRFFQFSQDHIYDAAYVRVRDIILGYTMPQKALTNTFFNNLRFTAQVTNPFIWVKNDLNLDPEAFVGANSMEAYQNLSTLTFGVKANF